MRIEIGLMPNPSLIYSLDRIRVDQPILLPNGIYCLYDNDKLIQPEIFPFFKSSVGFGKWVGPRPGPILVGLNLYVFFINYAKRLVLEG